MALKHKRKWSSCLGEQTQKVREHADRKLNSDTKKETKKKKIEYKYECEGEIR